MWKRTARVSMLILAWIFIVGSLSALAWDLGWPPLGSASEQEDTYILRANVDGKQYTSFGLTFVGQAGHLLRLVEIVSVLVATLLSLLPWDGARRVGLLALVAWAGLWLGNALCMAIVAPIWVFMVAGAFMLVFFVAQVARAGLAWSKRSRNGPTPTEAAPFVMRSRQESF